MSSEPPSPKNTPGLPKTEAQSRVDGADTADTKGDTLENLRQAIDASDQQLLDVLNRRAALAQRVGAVKLRNGEPFYRPERERHILDRVVKNANGPLPAASLRTIFREVISACLAVESPLEVAYLGPEATFTHEAAKAQFGMSALMLPRSSIAEVFDDVVAKRCDYGVVPVENSLDGVVKTTLDGFIRTDVCITGEVLVDIRHQLMSQTGRLETIEVIYSHPQAFGQCQTWIQRHLPQAARMEVASTARAAQLASKEANAGAIASDLAADLYGLQVVARGLEDSVGNLTRFWVIGTTPTEMSGEDKTSVVFTLKDQPGALHQALAHFGGINLTRIESRPSKRKAWEYLFFIDLEGHRHETKVAGALDALCSEASFFRILGSYPRYTSVPS